MLVHQPQIMTVLQNQGQELLRALTEDRRILSQAMSEDLRRPVPAELDLPTDDVLDGGDLREALRALRDRAQALHRRDPRPARIDLPVDRHPPDEDVEPVLVRALPRRAQRRVPQLRHPLVRAVRFPQVALLVAVVRERGPRVRADRLLRRV